MNGCCKIKQIKRDSAAHHFRSKRETARNDENPRMKERAGSDRGFVASFVENGFCWRKKMSFKN